MLIVDKESMNDKFILAAMNNDVVQLRKLFADGVDINAKKSDGTALYWAAQFGKLDIVSTLISFKADVNIADVSGWTPLMYAVKLGKVSIIKLLIAGGTNLFLKNMHGFTALDLAEKHDQIEIIFILKRAMKQQVEIEKKKRSIENLKAKILWMIPYKRRG